MGLILDTDVLIRAERDPAAVDFNLWAEHGEAFISAITCSELLVGVHLANTKARRLKRAAFVEAVLQALPTLPFDQEVARVHAHLLASLTKSVTLGAHDLIIGATAIRHGYAVLTGNHADFRRMPGVTVLDFP
jgi:Predicted nucleic acid-binding protein, contains PIN domain